VAIKDDSIPMMLANKAPVSVIRSAPIRPVKRGTCLSEAQPLIAHEITEWTAKTITEASCHAHISTADLGFVKGTEEHSRKSL
jgi:hypothetical protein